MHHTWPPHTKADYQQEKKQKTYKLINAKQLSTECKIDFPELNENEYITYQNLCGTLNTVLRGKFIGRV